MVNTQLDNPPKTKHLTAEVNRDLCIGAASCVVLAPTVFELDSDGKAIIKPGSLEGVDDQALMEAAQSCPTGAITITDANGHKLWPKT